MKELKVYVDKPTKPLGDLFGLFFEDLNHAADGGLYGELVQNRSFEFDLIDNKNYHALTAWEKAGEAALEVRTDDPAFPENPHYLRLTALNPLDGVKNMGYGAGIPIRSGEGYAFCCYARAGEMTALRVSLENEDGRVFASAEIAVCGGWTKYRSELTPDSTDMAGRLVLRLPHASSLDLDFVSLFPKETFRGRENGLRTDIAQALAEMRPKFLRFPGGCLVHDGTLNAADRDSMYRWKNTIGPPEHRPSKRSGWQYNQTLGLGFYEYFLFCEDIGAKPLPVVPGGCDPHHRRFATGDVLQSFIDDALDLIEFANGGMDTAWGAKRAQMGHPQPFHMEYIAIGNEEVHQEFYDRLPLFVKAIREKYPSIKIIGSAGPFPAGGEFERGWRSAEETCIDLVDEHYYQAPEWYLANADRYTKYPADGPKVFLGEYASWGNTFENALAEAAYMTNLQNAPAVGLACYAPMLCHKDYVNWRPDLIWFDNHRVLRTANYHVQSMFMRHQGDVLLHTEAKGLSAKVLQPDPPISGAVWLGANDTRMELTNIMLQTGGQVLRLPDTAISGQDRVLLAEACDAPFTLTFSARRLEGKKGMRVFFEEKDRDNCLIWGIGGWENQDCILDKRTRGRGSCLTQSGFSMEDGREYALRLVVDGRTVSTYIDGVLYNQAEDKLPQPNVLYHTTSLDTATGEVILKAVNVSDEPAEVLVRLEGMGDGGLEGSVESLTSLDPGAENTFDKPDCVTPTIHSFSSLEACFSYTFPAYSITALRLKKAPR